jgi:hypothetical protein
MSVTINDILYGLLGGNNGGMSFKPPVPASSPSSSSAGNGSAYASSGGCGCGGGSGPGTSGGPIGSTSTPVTAPPAPIGASSGITSPQPTNPAGFLGYSGGPAQGTGWPNGGIKPPRAYYRGIRSNAQTPGAPRKLVNTSAEGTFAAPVVATVSPSTTLNLLGIAVLGVIAYVAWKAAEG